MQVDDYGEVITVERVSARIHIPVLPNPHLREIMELMASTFTTSIPDIEVNGDELVVESEPDDGKIQTAINEVKREVEWRNRDIRQRNEELTNRIEAFVRSRKEKIQNEEQLFDQIAQRVPVTLYRRDKPVTPVFPTVAVKNVIQPVMPPRASPPQEVQLKLEHFQAILELIHNNMPRLRENTGDIFKDG